MFWTCFCLDNCPVIYTVTLYTASDTFRILADSELCLLKYIQTYSSIFSIHSYWGIFKAYLGLFRHIQHPLFTTLLYSEPRHLEPEAYLKPCETLTRHIQNSAIVRIVYPSIIQSYSGIFRTLCNACIYRNLAYSQT